jgi:hypothetical protein
MRPATIGIKLDLSGAEIGGNDSWESPMARCEQPPFGNVVTWPPLLEKIFREFA